MQSSDHLVHRILEAARAVHRTLGPGFLESIYSRALIEELKTRELRVEREKRIKIWYGDRVVGTHRLDLIVDGSIIIELKANRGIIQVHLAQMTSYLHATEYPCGVIVNFGKTELEWKMVGRSSGG